jgi:hypothetical protein
MSHGVQFSVVKTWRGKMLQVQLVQKLWENGGG